MPQLFINVIHFIVEPHLFYLFGEEIAHIRFHIIPIARQYILARCWRHLRHHLHTRQHRICPVVHHYQLLINHRLVRCRKLVTYRQPHVIHPILQRKALHIYEVEIQLIERPHCGTIQIVFLQKTHRIVLPYHQRHLHSASVHPIRLLLILQRPRIERQICLHIGHILTWYIECAVRKHRLQLSTCHAHTCSQHQSQYR